MISSQLYTMIGCVTLIALCAPTSCIQEKGSLEVICGPTCSGKTTELIRRLKHAQHQHLSTIYFQYNYQSTQPIQKNIVARSGSSMTGFTTKETTLMNQLAADAAVIGIDEAQFFSPEIVGIIETLINQGKRVIVAGLDLNYRLIPFGSMSLLMAKADKVTKLHAQCVRCGKKACLGQRMINKKPAPFDMPDPIGPLLENELYEPRCRTCFEIDHQVNATALARAYTNIQQGIQ